MTIPDQFKVHDEQIKKLEIKCNMMASELQRQNEKIRQLENALYRK